MRAKICLCSLGVPLLLADIALAAAPSPDGQRLAFSFIGGPESIYLAQGDGTQARDLVVRETRDFRPEWFPDGRHLLFTSAVEGGPQLFQVGIDGEQPTALTPVRLHASDGHPSPDGTEVVFFRDAEDGFDLHVLELATGAIRSLTRTPGFREYAPRWSPDGTKVVFVGRVDAETPPDIWILDLASGERANVTRTPDADESHPAWSNDGREVTFIRVLDGEFAVHVVDLASGADVRVAYKPGVACFAPHFTPDDRWITFTRNVFEGSKAGLPAVFRVRPDGTCLRRLAGVPAPPAEAREGGAPGWARVLDWEPDPAVVADPEVRRRIAATGAPWRVLHEASGVELLLVPPGAYLRGAGPDDPYDRENERPQHRVEITYPFSLGRYEVTNPQMRRFRRNHDSGRFYRDESLSLDADAMPAVDVSWLDATAFAEHFGFRLPTEAEWEYAARAGVESRYPWGNDPNAGGGPNPGDAWGNVFNQAVKRIIPEMGWEAFPWDDGFIVSAPVGSFRPNAWGFYDLFGNAWEWCRDAYQEDEYRRHADGAVDPVAQGGKLKTLRGGGWGNAPRGSGIPYRFGMDEGDRFDGNGFRVARSLE